MAVPRHVRVTVSGTYDSAFPAMAEEEWAFSWNATHNVSEGTPQQIADASWAGVASKFSEAATTGVINAAYHLRQLKIAFIDANGHYEQAAGVHQGDVPALVSTPAGWIPQGTVCITTIHDPIFRGKGRYGRFYVPGYTTGGTGVLTATLQDKYIDWANSLLQKVLHTSGGVPLVPCHVPDNSTTPLPITSLRCGQVVDTQRRRRNKVAELPRSKPTIWA